MKQRNNRNGKQKRRAAVVRRVFAILLALTLMCAELPSMLPGGNEVGALSNVLAAEALEQAEIQDVHQETAPEEEKDPRVDGEGETVPTEGTENKSETTEGTEGESGVETTEGTENKSDATEGTENKSDTTDENENQSEVTEGTEAEDGTADGTQKGKTAEEPKSNLPGDEESEEDFYGYLPIEEAEDFEIPTVGLSESEISSVLGGDIPAEVPSQYIPDIYSFSRVKGQSPYGTCWAFSSVAAMELSMIMQGYATGDEIDLSELQTAYFTYGGLYGESTTDPLGGLEGDSHRVPQSHLEALKDAGKTYFDVGGNLLFTSQDYANWVGGGQEDQDVLRYTNAKNALSGGIDEKYRFYNAVHVQDVYQVNLHTEPELAKQLIAKYGSIITSYNDKSAYYDVNHNSYYNPTNYSSNHAICIVGWDDDYSVSNFNQIIKPSSPGAWLVRNSWGVNGYSRYGYFWMSYEDQTLGKVDAHAYRVEPADNYAYNYQYDGGDYFLVKASSSQKYSNVFQVYGSDPQVLEAVSVSFPDTTNVPYQIDIYKNPTSSTNPESGVHQEAATTRGQTTFSGIYTVTLDQSVSLLPGESFSVVVSFTDGKEYSLGREYGMTGSWYDIQVNSLAGQSYCYRSGSWSDYGASGKGNLRIKAFTNPGDFSLEGGTDALWESYDASVWTEIGTGISYSGAGELTVSDLPVPTRTGYNFEGWYTRQDGEGDKVEGPITGKKLYAYWSKKVALHLGCRTDQVSKLPEGDYNAEDTEIDCKVYGTFGMYWKKLPSQIRRGDLVFGGWYTGSSGTGDAVTDGTEYVDGVEPYALWNAVITLRTGQEKTIWNNTLPDHWYYHAADRTDSSNKISYRVGDLTLEVPMGTIIPALPIGSMLSWPGVTLLGWKTKDAVVTGSETISKNTVLFPVLNYEIAFDFDADEVSCGPVPAGYTFDSESSKVSGTYSSDSPLSFLPEGTREGYQFVGWFTAKNGGGRQLILGTDAALGSVVKWENGELAAPDGPTTYYAFWTEDCYELSVSTIEDQVYTGKNIKPTVSVFAGGQKLILGKDYTVSYQNSVLPALAGSARSPRVIVKGKGEYSDIVTMPFTILPCNLNAKDITAAAMIVRRSTAKNPVPVVKRGTTTLRAGTDFVVNCYYKEGGTEMLRTLANAEPGKYYALLIGKGNYVGANGEDSILEVPIFYTDSSPAASFNVLPIANQKYADVDPEGNVKAQVFYRVSGDATKRMLSPNQSIPTFTGKDKLYLSNGTNLVAENKQNGTYYELRDSNATTKIDVSDWIVPSTGQSVEDTVLDYQEVLSQRGITLEQVVANCNNMTLMALSFENCDAAGTATAVIRLWSLDGSSKSFEGEKRVAYKILGTSLTTAKVTGLASSLVYNGAERTFPVRNPDGTLTEGSETESPIQVSLGSGASAKILECGTDFSISYQNNENAGTATLILQGLGGYTGVLKKTFRILPYNIATDEGGKLGGYTDRIVSGKPANQASPLPAVSALKIPYTKTGNTPTAEQLSLTFGGAELVQGKDFKLTYQNKNAKANTVSDQTKWKPSYVKIIGMGNYTGTVTATYYVTPADLAEASITASDVLYRAGNGSWKATVAVTDASGARLVNGRDYENMVYTNAGDKTLVITRTVARVKTKLYVDPETAPTGQSGHVTVLEKSDLITGYLNGGQEVAGCVPGGIRIRVSITGKEAYGAGGSTISTVYRVSKNLISSASVKIPNQKFRAGGVVLSDYAQDQTLGMRVYKGNVTFTRVEAGNPESGSCYRVIAYEKNNKIGYATVTIEGLGDYGGTKKIKFRIVKSR